MHRLCSRENALKDRQGLDHRIVNFTGLVMGHRLHLMVLYQLEHVGCKPIGIRITGSYGQTVLTEDGISSALVRNWRDPGSCKTL